MFKTHPILGLVNSYIGDSPQPANISRSSKFIYRGFTTTSQY